jgi:hypothetical protein
LARLLYQYYQLAGKRGAMKKLMKKLEDIMVAVTFAEAGEYDEASRQLGDEQTMDEGAKQPSQGFAPKSALESTAK